MSQSRPRPTPIIETIFPGRRVHLIGGASGAGKTTWLMQILETWRKGEPVYGHASHPCPFVYLSYDRDDDDFIDTCERLKIDPETYNFHSPHGAALETPLLDYLTALQTRNPSTRLYIIEGIAMQTPAGKINDQRVVGSWLRRLQEFCKKYDVTIIGVLHSAKTKERDRYREPRAKIAGCGAWAGYSSTVVIIEEKEADGESELRELLILPRNAKKFRYLLDFKDGFLVPAEQKKSVKAKFEDWLMRQTPGTEFTVEAAILGSGVSKSMVHDAEIPRALNLKLITKTGHGRYKIVDPKGEN